MITNSQTPAGIALVCDNAGRISETIGDRLGMAGRFLAGRLFSACLDPGSFTNSLTFLTAIRKSQAAFEWELKAAGEDGQVRTLCFDGCIVDDNIVILGAATSHDLLGFLDELMRLEDDHVNWIRYALAEMSMKEAGAGRFQHDLYNELSRLNNELANAQREVIKKNFELERLNRLKNQFLGMAAHDLRRPAGLVLNYAEILAADAAGSLTPEQLRLLEIIRESAERMGRLIDDFLDVSLIEAGHFTLDVQVVALEDVVSAAGRLAEVAAGRRRIQIETDLDPSVRRLRVDGPKLEQVLANLLSNAVEHSPEDAVVTVGSRREAGGVRLWISDKGKGVPKEQQGSLFQAFAANCARKPGGERRAGLGLAIARKIVEAHGGLMFVESEPGLGSVFGFTLPESCLAARPIDGSEES